MNHTVEDMLRPFVSPTMTNRDEFLVHVHFAINNAWQESVQNTPVFLQHGCHPRMPLAVSLNKKRASSQKTTALGKVQQMHPVQLSLCKDTG